MHAGVTCRPRCKRDAADMLLANIHTDARPERWQICYRL